MFIKSNLAKIIKALAILALVLFIISFLIALIFGFPAKHTFRVVFGSIYVLLVPGFIWSYVFFPSLPFGRTPENSRTTEKPNRTLPLDEANGIKGIPTKAGIEKPLDVIERITLSIALSMAIGPLLIFFLNKIGVKINLLNSFLELLVLIIGGLIVIFIQETRKLKKSNAKI